MAPFANHRLRAFSVLALTRSLFSMAQQQTSTTTTTTCTSICGEGNAVMYPDAIIQFQDVFGQDRQFGCDQAQKMVESGLAPEGFCSQIVPYAVEPCRCVQPDGTPASVPSPRPVATVPAPTPVAAPNAGNETTCPRRRQVLDDCLSNIANGDDCTSCVTSYYPLFASTCATIDQETCTGLGNCPCGGCLNRFLRYIKCLAPQCASQMCQVDNVKTPSPAGARPGSPSPTQQKKPSNPFLDSSSSTPSFATASERTIFSGADADRPGASRNRCLALMAMTAIVSPVLT